MFGRYTRSWVMVKASAAILNQDRSLLLFPLISLVAMLLVVLSFALPLIGIEGLDGITAKHSEPAMYSLAFLFYVVQYFVIFFFNSALVGCVMLRMDGHEPRLRDGLAIAASKVGVIFAYAVVAATVGMVLRMIEERLGFLGRLVGGLVGIGWGLASSLAVPVLVARDVGPVAAVMESAQMLKNTWGENIGGHIRLGVGFMLIYIAIVVGGACLSIAAVGIGSHGLAVLCVTVTVVALFAAVMINVTLSSIYSVALYRYAVFGDVGAGFDKQLLDTAFMPKK